MGDPNPDDNDDNDNENENENENESKYMNTEGPCEADIEESKIAALMRRSITNGKVRKIVGTVLAIQSWPYNVKKEPPMVTSDTTPTASDVSTLRPIRDVMYGNLSIYSTIFLSIYELILTTDHFLSTSLHLHPTNFSVLVCKPIYLSV